MEKHQCDITIFVPNCQHLNESYSILYFKWHQGQLHHDLDCDLYTKNCFLAAVVSGGIGFHKQILFIYYHIQCSSNSYLPYVFFSFILYYRIEVDCQGIFKSGQLGVAISRTPSISGFRILNFNPKVIFPQDPVIFEFYAIDSQPEMENLVLSLYMVMIYNLWFR